MRRLAPVLLVLLAGCSSSHRTTQTATTPSPVVSPSTSSATPAPSASAGPGTSGAPTAMATQTVPVPVGGPVPAGFSPTSVTFVSRTTGWVLGSCGQGCTAVLRTTDGGRHWRGLPATPEPQGAAGTVTGLRFADFRNGFAYGGGLYATHDGGTSWGRVPVAGRVTDVAAAGGRVWLVVDHCDSAGSCPPVTLMSGSVSGGPLTTAASAPAPQLPGDEQVVAHAATAYLVVGPSSAQTRAVLAGPGGTRAMPCAAGESAALAAATSRLLLVCSGDVAAGQQRKTAWTSTDDGRHWSAQGNPPQVAGTTVAVTAGAAYLGNSRTGVDVTRDGRSWAPSLASDAGVSYVGLLDETFGEALVGTSPQAVLELTSDGGRHWAPVRF